MSSDAAPEASSFLGTGMVELRSSSSRVGYRGVRVIILRCMIKK